MRAFSFGGGVQSTAALVLAAAGIIDYKLFLFANVGEDAENDETLTYVEQWAKPFAARHHLWLIEVRKRNRARQPVTLTQTILRSGSRSIPIPARMPLTGAPGTRSCTQEFKIRPIAKWLKTHGASKSQPATMGLGISTDERLRMRTGSGFDHYTLDYPLISLSLSRLDCQQVIREARLPIPPKSSCYYCPYHRLTTWKEMQRQRPDQLAKAAQIEATIIERRAALGKDPVYLTRYGKPLLQVVGTNVQEPLWAEDEVCDSGYCLT